MGHEGEVAQHLGPGIWHTPEDWNRSDGGRGPKGAKTGLRLPPRQPWALFGRPAADDDPLHQDSASIPRPRIACKTCVAKLPIVPSAPAAHAHATNWSPGPCAMNSPPLNELLLMLLSLPWATTLTIWMRCAPLRGSWPPRTGKPSARSREYAEVGCICTLLAPPDTSTTARARSSTP